MHYDTLRTLEESAGYISQRTNCVMDTNKDRFCKKHYESISVHHAAMSDKLCQRVTALDAMNDMIIVGSPPHALNFYVWFDYLYYDRHTK